MAVKHTTPADGTFSASGTTAWNENHTIEAGTVTLAMQADMASGYVLYRKTAGAGVPEIQTLATLKTDLGLATGVAWITKTSGYTASSGDSILSDTSGGGFTITLPATPSANDYVVIKSGYSASPTKALTIARNGSEIMNLAEDMTVTTPNIEMTLVYNATTGWTL
jgi:hypothetical protein